MKGSGFGPVCIGKRDLSYDCYIGVIEPFSVIGSTFIIYKWEVDVFMTGNRRFENFQQLTPKVGRGRNVIVNH